MQNAECRIVVSLRDNLNHRRRRYLHFEFCILHLSLYERKHQALDTLISNVTVVTMNPKMEVLFGAYIGIEDGKITSIEKSAPQEQPKTIIDGTGMVAIPGLINCHTHLATSGLRS